MELGYRWALGALRKGRAVTPQVSDLPESTHGYIDHTGSGCHQLNPVVTAKERGEKCQHSRVSDWLYMNHAGLSSTEPCSDAQQ
jgi:hypothetical protein